MEAGRAFLICILAMLISVATCSNEINPDEGRCIGMAQAVPGFVSVAVHQPIPAFVEWVTTIDLTDAEQMQHLICNMYGRSPEEIVEYLTSSGIATAFVRRFYGIMVASLEQIAPIISSVVEMSPNHSTNRALGLEVLRLIRLLDGYRFLQLDDEAVQEATDFVAGNPMKREVQNGCDELNDISHRVAEIIGADMWYQVDDIVAAVSGISLSDNTTMYSLECRLVNCDSIDEILVVLNDFDVIQSILEFGLERLQSLPSYLNLPIQLYEYTVVLPDRALRKILLVQNSSMSVEEYRVRVNAVLSFNRELQVFLASIRNRAEI